MRGLVQPGLAALGGAALIWAAFSYGPAVRPWLLRLARRPPPRKPQASAPFAIVRLLTPLEPLRCAEGNRAMLTTSTPTVTGSRASGLGEIGFDSEAGKLAGR